MRGGARTYKAINVRPEMSSVVFEQGPHGTEPTPLRWAHVYTGPMWNLLAGAPGLLRPFSHPAACLYLHRTAYVRKVLGQGERLILSVGEIVLKVFSAKVLSVHFH